MKIRKHSAIKKERHPWETDADGKAIPQDHHITPKSRGGEHTPKNIAERIPSDLHWAWHKLFGNLKPLEIITVLLRYFFRGGRFHSRYQRIVKKEGRPPPVMTPDEVIIALEEEVFPENWAPSKELIEKLKRRRERLLPD